MLSRFVLLFISGLIQFYHGRPVLDDETAALNYPTYKEPGKWYLRAVNLVIKELLEFVDRLARVRGVGFTRSTRSWMRSLPLFRHLFNFGSFAILVSIASIIVSGSITSRNVVSSNSAACGLFTLEREMEGVSPIINYHYSQDLEARINAMQCFGSTNDTSACDSFVSPNLPVYQTDVDCPFSDDLCLEGSSAIKLSTNLVDSKSLGINVPKGYSFNRLTTCAPLDRNVHVVLSEDRSSYEYYYGSNSEVSTWSNPAENRPGSARYQME